MSNIQLFENKQIRTVWNELKSQNLRDHINDLELIFPMLGEASTTAIVKTQNPEGFVENKKAARQVGSVAGKSRWDIEDAVAEEKLPVIQNIFLNSFSEIRNNFCVYQNGKLRIRTNL